MRWNKIAILVCIIALVAFVAVLAVRPVIPGVPPFTGMIKQGLDLQGGVHVVLEAQGSPEAPVTPDAVNRSIAIIERRINAFGVAEPVVQQQGANRIIVELAGVTDPDEAVRNMLRTAFLEFKTEDGTTVLTGEHLRDAQEGRHPQSGVAEVNLEFDNEGARIFAEITAANVGRNISILIDGEVIQSPRVNEAIPNGKAQISPYESLEAAHDIAILLRSGALPTKLEVLEKRTVGPTLGADSLEKSVKAGLIGLAAILLFMFLYYRLPGLIADLSLVTYALIVLLIFAGINATMTLPGICGFLLSLGMAVDANILIFERLKEELWAGKTLGSAIDAGFKRAFVTIVDANVTTLLAAAVLFYFGTGPVKGFAVTLSIGIVASMFTAITVTRFLLRLVADSNLARNVKLYGA